MGGTSKLEFESRAPCGNGGDARGAVVQLRDGSDHRKPEPSAAHIAAGSRWIGAIERLEQVRQVLRRDRGAGIRHGYADAMIRDILHADIDAPTLWGMRHGVFEEMIDDTSRELGVDRRPVSALHCARNSDVLLFETTMQIVQRLVDQVRDIRRGSMQRE